MGGGLTVGCLGRRHQPASPSGPGRGPRGRRGPSTTTQDRLSPQVLGHRAHAVLPSAPNLVGVTARLPLTCAHVAPTHQEAQGASPQGTLQVALVTS